MSIKSDLERLITAKNNLIAALDGKGAEIPENPTINDLVGLVEDIFNADGPALQNNTITLHTPTTASVISQKYATKAEINYITDDVVSFSGAFDGTHTSLKELYFSRSVPTNNIQCMCRKCTALHTAEIKVYGDSVNMYGAFAYCTKLANLTLDGEIKASSMSEMFYSCTSLTQLSLPNVSLIANSTSESGMCAYCSNLTEFHGPNLIAGTNCGDMFKQCASLKKITLKSHPQYGNDIFADCASVLEELVFTDPTARFRNGSSFTLTWPAMSAANFMTFVNSTAAATDGYSKIFNLSADAYADLTDDDLAVIAAKGYTVQAIE